MKLSIVIPAWNAKPFLEDCINSIERSGFKDKEIIIVDNASSDGSIEKIAGLYPHIKFIKNKINVGVSPASNQGVQASTGKYILLLDADTIIQDNALQELTNYMDNHPDVGLCGAMLRYQNGDLQHSAQRFPVLNTKLARIFPDSRWSKKILTGDEYRNFTYDKPVEVDYLLGACHFISRKALESVGPLDDRLFYGPHDCDYCLRMHLAGWRVIYNPDAVIIHRFNRLSRKKIKMFLKHLKCLSIYFLKHKYLFSRKRIYKQISKHKPHYLIAEVNKV